MDLRGYREEDRGAVARLAAGSLGGSVGEWEEKYEPARNPRFDPGQVRVIEEDGEVRANAAVLPLEVFVDGGLARMGGIADVATHPAYRRRGYAGELMRATLRLMRERGVHLSMLHPFAHAFYRAYGWELATESIRYALKPTDLPTSPEQRRVRAYREEDLPRMMGMLEERASERPCCVRRGEARWRQFLSREGEEAAVYEKGGRLEGYLLYRQRSGGGDPPRTLDVSDFVAGTLEARAGLLSFMAAYNPEEYKVGYAVPRGEPLHPYLRNSYVDAGISPEFMLRLVDVGGALGLLDREADEPLVLGVADDVIPENAGEYTVGNGGVTRGAEAEERVSLDVRQLAQLYAGYLPARQLARLGLIQSGSPRALELLETYFPVGDPWVSPPDHF